MVQEQIQSLIAQTVRKVYSITIRDYSPEKYQLLAGVAVMGIPVLETQDDDPSYKVGLIQSIHDCVDEGDEVELVGFGRGVSTIHAFDAGAESVVAYEASTMMIKKGKQTVDVNRPFDIDLEIQQSVVGTPKDIYGDFSEADVTSPTELSTTDVLILDCEGSEHSIIKDLGTYPQKIIVETHPEFQAPTDSIVRIIPESYDITVVDYHPDYPNKDIIKAVQS